MPVTACGPLSGRALLLSIYAKQQPRAACRTLPWAGSCASIAPVRRRIRLSRMYRESEVAAPDWPAALHFVGPGVKCIAQNMFRARLEVARALNARA